MKLCSAIVLLGTFCQAYSIGRYELVYDNMSITSTDPRLKGTMEFHTPDGEDIEYSANYYDMTGFSNPSSCLEGTPVESTGALTYDVESKSRDYTDTFDLPVSVWNGGNSASFCVRVTNTYEGEVIDEIEVLASITRSFTGDFEMSVATKTKDTKSFESTDNENEIDVNSFLCDNSFVSISNQEDAFDQGQGNKLHKAVVCGCR